VLLCFYVPAFIFAPPEQMPILLKLVDACAQFIWEMLKQSFLLS